MNNETIKDIISTVEKPSDASILYVVYKILSDDQKTNIIRTVDSILIENLNWSKQRLSKAHKVLTDLTLVEYVKERKNGKVVRWLVKINK